MELTKDRLIIVICAGIAVLCMAVYLILYAPLIGRIRAEGMNLRQIEARLFDSRGTISSIESMKRNAIFISEDDVSAAIDELTKKGESLGIDFVSITPRGIERKSGYGVLPINMVIESGYRELGLFLGALSSLEKSMVKVDAFEVAPHSEGPSRLKTKVTINIYLRGNDDEG